MLYISHYYIQHTIFFSLFQHNSIVQTLDLSENDMGPRGAEYIADMLKENNFVVNLVRDF